ncbi:MAG TPA: dTDP-4-dehydrorhamnose 3,5-epimerase [Deltaproteobacteria bacterium]|nr:dTDP-4-dehydrorhamnose 3,5-epimerase [Deltaproteobacteria bacterium]
MQFIETTLQDVFIVEPSVHKDQRGFFLEAFSSRIFRDYGIAVDFVQDNCSFSKSSGVIRGLHFQYPPHAQAKLIWVITGSILDVVVDLRRASPTYGKWLSVEMSSSPVRMLYVPRGFAHGFCTLRNSTRVLYKVDAFYAPHADAGIRWNDPDLAIVWPTQSPIVSAKDSRLPSLSDIPPVF